MEVPGAALYPVPATDGERQKPQCRYNGNCQRTGRLHVGHSESYTDSNMKRFFKERYNPYSRSFPGLPTEGLPGFPCSLGKRLTPAELTPLWTGVRDRKIQKG